MCGGNVNVIIELSFHAPLS